MNYPRMTSFTSSYPGRPTIPNVPTLPSVGKHLVGVQGRVGKLPDSCYSFWVGASACILANKSILSPNIGNFLHICMTAAGSYSKFPEADRGDPLHTLHSLVGGKILRDQWE